MAGELTAILLTRLRYRVCDVGAARWDDADCYDALSRAQRAVTIDLNDNALWPLANVDETTLTEGVQEYALPDDLLRVRALRYKTGWAQLWDVAHLGVLVADETDPAYVLWNGQVRFRNVVTQDDGDTYVMLYMRHPADIAATVNPSLPVQYWGLLLEYAAGLLFQGDELLQDVAQRAMQRYQDLVAVVNGVYSTPMSAENIPVDARQR